MDEKNAFSPPFKWTALEYEYFPKSADWFWAVIILIAAIAAAAVILGNFLFGVLILASGLAVILYGLRKPQMIDFAITSRGVQIQNKLYPFDALESFWVHYDPPHKKEISLKSKKAFMPYIQIPLADTDPNVLREFLIKFVKEKEHQEPFSDTLMRVFKL